MGPLDDGPATTSSAHSRVRDTAAREEPPTEQSGSSRLQALTNIEGTLDLITRTACRCLPEIERVSICVVDRDGHIDTRAATSNVPGGIRSRQPRRGEDLARPGASARPAVRAQQGQSMESAHLVDRQPSVKTEAILRIPVFTDEHHTGVLTMYAPPKASAATRARRIGELLAHHAALALDRSDRNLDLQPMSVQRQTIEEAVSTLMDRHQLDENGAYEYLVRTCQHSSLHLPELAGEVVAAAGSSESRLQAPRADTRITVVAPRC